MNINLCPIQPQQLDIRECPHRKRVVDLKRVDGCDVKVCSREG